MYITVRAEEIAKLKGFDWHLQDQSEEYIDEINQMNSDNKEFTQKLIEQGIDPMFYFKDELKETFTHEILDYPLIGGIHWNNEVVLDGIRQQINKKDSWSK